MISMTRRRQKDRISRWRYLFLLSSVLIWFIHIDMASGSDVIDLDNAEENDSRSETNISIVVDEEQEEETLADQGKEVDKSFVSTADHDTKNSSSALLAQRSDEPNGDNQIDSSIDEVPREQESIVKDSSNNTKLSAEIPLHSTTDRLNTIESKSGEIDDEEGVKSPESFNLENQENDHSDKPTDTSEDTKRNIGYDQNDENATIQEDTRVEDIGGDKSEDQKAYDSESSEGDNSTDKTEDLEHSAGLEDGVPKAEEDNEEVDEIETDESEVGPDTENNGDTVEEAPEGSMASFFNKVKKDNGQTKTTKGSDKASFSSPATTSFEALKSQQQHINAHDPEWNKIENQRFDGKELPGEAKNRSDLPSKTHEYKGFPWGKIDSQHQSHHYSIPDMDLLYLVFQDRLRKDLGLPSKAEISKESLFPLSMGHLGAQDEIFPDDDLLELELQAIQQQLMAQLQANEAADWSSVSSLYQEVRQFESKGAQESFQIQEAQSAQKAQPKDQHHEEDMDDIDNFFQGVSPPDELDVGAASGSSMQELIMAKGREILVKRIRLGYRFFNRFVRIAKEHIQTKASELYAKISNAIRKDGDESEVPVFGSDALDDFERIQATREADEGDASLWKVVNEKAMDAWKMGGRGLRWASNFLNRLLDGDVEDEQDGSIFSGGSSFMNEEDFYDLEAIRKRNGL